jgi:hypothetical protein
VHRARWILGSLAVAALCAAPVGAQDTTRVERMGPAFGDGRLWVRPLPFTPAELAARLGGGTTQGAIDSIVSEMIQGYLDAVAAGANAAQAPSWVTSLGGQTVGVDPAWIHLGPIKLPTFLLGLIPLNVQANPQQVAQSRRWAEMRQMIQLQGARDAALDDIGRAARELREQREADREFERNQRTPPPTSGEGRP